MRRAVSLFLALLMVLSVPAYAAGEDTAAQRREDLDTLYEALKEYHPNLFANAAEEALLAKKAEIEGRLAAVDDATFALDLQSLVAMIGDSHTSLNISGVLSSGSMFPFSIRWFDGAWVVTGLPETEAAYLGWTIAALNGQTMGQVCDKLGGLLSSDNPIKLRRQVRQCIASAEVLAYTGVVDAGAELHLALTGPDGEEAEVVLSALSASDDAAWPAVVQLSSRRTQVPATAAQDRYYFSLDLGDAYYIQFNTCQEDPELPMETFAAQVAEDLSAKDYDKVLIDLRNNSGGSDGVLVPILMLLAPMVRSGAVEVWGLVGEATFSSAAINAMEIREMGGYLAGEATSGSVDHFGSVGSFRLPNSGIQVQCSTKYITLADYLECAVGLGVTAIQPDWEVPQTLEDYLAGRDTAVEALLARQEPFSAAEQPQAPLSRGRFIAMLRQAVGAQADTWGMPFDDVFPFNWYVPDIVWAVELGIVGGKAEGMFAPTHCITWEEAAVLAERYLDAADAEIPIVQDGQAPGWVDALSHPWAAQYVEAAWRHGLLRDDCSPQAAICRQEGQEFLSRFVTALG